MKIAITDACIFIDLYELDLLAVFFNLPITVHTSIDVIYELYEEQQQSITWYTGVEKLFVHSIGAEDLALLHSGNYSTSLSNSDKTVLFLAEKLNAMVLSSDKAVRTAAKKRAIAYHGMLWIFDELVKFNELTPRDACIKLRRLISTNQMFQNNKVLVEEMEVRLARWGDGREDGV